MRNVIAIEIKNYKVNVEDGYELLSGWTVACAETGKLFTVDGIRPWLPRGGKGSALEVQASGLLDHAAFLSAA